MSTLSIGNKGWYFQNHHSDLAASVLFFKSDRGFRSSVLAEDQWELCAWPTLTCLQIPPGATLHLQAPKYLWNHVVNHCWRWRIPSEFKVHWVLWSFHCRIHKTSFELPFVLFQEHNPLASSHMEIITFLLCLHLYSVDIYIYIYDR